MGLDFVIYMMGKYFLISILIGALFYSCEKPTDYTLDNKKDPENKDYIPTEPDSFFVFKNTEKVPNLVWRDNSEAESGFLIKKKIGNGEFNLVESTTSNQSNWTDESYKPSEPIIYGIKAYNDNGESDLVESVPLLSYLSVGLEVNGSGTVSLSNFPELTDSVLYGTELSLLAEPEDCWDFVNWNDKVFESSNTFVVTSDTTIRVNFVENTIGYEIQINTSGQGEIILEPNKATYSCGDIVEIEAIPSENWEFSGWNSIASSKNPLSIEVGSDLNITAIFTEIPDEPFYLHSNGVTIVCDNTDVGVSFVMNGKTFTKRTKEQITTSNASSTCTSGITDMSALFTWERSFNQDISHWDVSDVTNMHALFITAESFNQDISHWDVSKVTRMSSMFYAAHSFNQDIGNWDVSNVEDMRLMFSRALNFNQNISQWNVSNVEDMGGMFGSYSNLKGSFNQNLSGWCVTKITEEPSGFAYNGSLTEQNKPKWGTCPSE